VQILYINRFRNDNLISYRHGIVTALNKTIHERLAEVEYCVDDTRMDSFEEQ